MIPGPAARQSAVAKQAGNAYLVEWVPGFGEYFP